MTNSEQDEHFLSRWSRRKLDENKSLDITSETESLATETLEHDDDVSEASALPESTEELPLWQQKDVDPELKRNALRNLFQQAEFNYRDGLNDYDHDFTQQPKLGGIVTAQMKRMIKLAQQKVQPESDGLMDVHEPITIASAAENLEQATEYNEDDKIA